MTKPRRLRRLPGFEDNFIAVPGLGTFALEGVGNQNGSTGIWVYFQKEGAEEAEPGYMPFSIAIDDDMQIVWEINRVHAQRRTWDPRPLEESFAPEALAAARNIVETLEQRDATKFMFEIAYPINEEIERHRKEIASVEYSINHQRRVLEGRAKAYRPREETEALLDKLERDLAELKDIPKGSRLDRIMAARSIIREWSYERGPKMDGPALRKAIQDALTAEPAAELTP